VTTSRRIAGLLGPTLATVTLSETAFVNPHLYEHQIAPVVYLSGTLLFIAGLSIVRVHNFWKLSWPLLITLVGWFAILLGLLRMFATRLYQQGAHDGIPLLAMELVGFGIGIFLTFKAYGREDG